jgi:hypothetical protein
MINKTFIDKHYLSIKLCFVQILLIILYTIIYFVFLRPSNYLTFSIFIYGVAVQSKWLYYDYKRYIEEYEINLLKEIIE